VLARITRGAEQSAVDYIELMQNRRDLIARFERRMEAHDLLVFPTAPIVPPPISAFDKDADFVRLNALILRNASVVNLLDGCAISIPAARTPDAPVGLMLAAPAGRDRSLFACAAAVERVLQPV
jgi:aspartyl-tRNA(Asn)/glutamyl-tRNA(Gln) amidotransferase subunit A